MIPLNEILELADSSKGGAALVAAYIINHCLKKTPLMSNKWLPLIGMVVGLGVGLLFGFIDQDWQHNILLGITGGATSTTLNELYKHWFVEGKGDADA